MTDTLEKVPTNGKGGLYSEIGNRNLYKPWGFQREEFLPQLRGQRGMQIYREMCDNDPIVGAVLFAIEMILRRIEWEVDAGLDEDEEPDQGRIEAAEFLTECMDDMSHSWEDFVADVLTMLPFGYSYMEIVYKQRGGPTQKNPQKHSRFTDGKIGWRKFMLIPPTTITKFYYDETGGIQGVDQQTGSGKAVIPIEKALLFRTTKRYPTGRSVLRNAYLPWYFKKRIEEIEGIGIERDLAGLPVIYLDPDIIADKTRKQEYEEIIRNVRRDEQEGVMLPAVYDESGNQLVKLELLSTGGTRQFDTNTIIGRYSRTVAMTLLQDVIMLGHEKIGTQALAVEKRDLSDTALAAWLNEIAAVINTHAVPRLLELNGFDLENPPEIVPGDLRQEDVLDFTSALANASQAGFQLAGDPEVENFVRRRLGLPLMDEEGQEMLALQREAGIMGMMGLAGGEDPNADPNAEEEEPPEDEEQPPPGKPKATAPPFGAKPKPKPVAKARRRKYRIRNAGRRG